MDLDIRFRGRCKTKVEPQITLRDVASPTADLIHLPMAAFGGTKYSRTDAGAITLYTNRLHLYPVILDRTLAPEKLRVIVDAIHHNIEIPVIIEITNGTSPPRN